MTLQDVKVKSGGTVVATVPPRKLVTYSDKTLVLDNVEWSGPYQKNVNERLKMLQKKVTVEALIEPGEDEDYEDLAFQKEMMITKICIGKADTEITLEA